MITFNWETVGHANVLKFLENSVINEKIANAYLFYGPKNIGKSLIADKFAKILFCPNSNKPCENCLTCAQINKQIHPDIYRISKQTEKKDILIEQIQELKVWLSHSTFFNSYKLAIINEAEFINVHGWNSLLKIMEEPPSKTVIILLANQLNKIPLTILSRCQQIKFSLISQKIIKDFLVSRGIAHSLVIKISKLAGGKIGLANKIAANLNWEREYLEKTKEYLKLFAGDESLKNKNSIIERFIKDEKDFNELFNDLLLFINDLILLDHAPDLIVNISFMEELSLIRAHINPKKIINLLETVFKAKASMTQNANPKLLLENIVLEAS